MKKFTNHVDHVAWISRLENLEANLAALEARAGAKLLRYEHREKGYVICVNWAAGIEVLAPLADRTDYNGMMHDWLDTRGEGVIFVAFGVADLARHAARLEAMGIEVSPPFEDRADTPWKDQLVLREQIAGTVMNSYFVLADIDYADGLIGFGDA
jgi:hypothetical protein